MTFNQNSKIDRQDVLFTIDFNSKNEIVVSDIDRDVSVESLHYKFPDDRQHFWIYLQKDILTIGTGDELVSASQILLTYQHEKLQQVNSFMFDKIYSSNVQIHHQLILSQKLELVEELNQLLNDKSFQDLVNEKPMLKEANMLLGDPCYEKPDFSMIDMNDTAALVKFLDSAIKDQDSGNLQMKGHYTTKIKWECDPSTALDFEFLNIGKDHCLNSLVVLTKFLCPQRYNNLPGIQDIFDDDKMDKTLCFTNAFEADEHNNNKYSIKKQLRDIGF